MQPPPTGSPSTLEPAPPGHWVSLYRSVAQIDFYAGVPGIPIGRCFAYFLLIVAIVWVAHSYQTFRQIEQGLQVILPALKERMPVVRIENGRASTEQPGPHVILEGDWSGMKCVLAVDVEGKLSDRNYDFALILSRDGIIAKNAVVGGETTKFPEQAEPLTVGPKEAEYWAHQFADFIAVLWILILSVFHLLTKLVTVGALSVGAVIANEVGKRAYAYPALFRISIYALTGLAALETLGYLMNRNLWFWGLVASFVIAVLGTLARTAGRRVGPAAA